MVAARRCGGAAVAGGDAGDVRSVERRLGIGRQASRLPAVGPGKTRATITFGVVALVTPRGKPAGYEKPAGLK